MNKWTHVLLVEDDVNFGTTLKEILELKDFKVTWFQNGMDALSYLVIEPVDIIISDIMMPIMNGFELQEELKAYEIAQNIPIIFMTAFGNSEMVKHFSKNQLCVFKPFESAFLIQQINKLLANKKSDSKKEMDAFISEDSDVQILEHVKYVMDLYYNQSDIYQTLIQKTGISKYKLERLLLNTYNQNIRGYIHQYRVKKALELINHGHLNVSEISLKVGYSNTNRFTEVFEKVVGMTPKKFILKING